MSSQADLETELTIAQWEAGEADAKNLIADGQLSEQSVAQWQTDIHLDTQLPSAPDYRDTSHHQDGFISTILGQ